MGCCLSSATPTDKSSSAQKHPHFPRSEEEEEDSRAPPPVVDEETVKEVLSETPNPKQEPFFDHRTRAHPHQQEEEQEEDNKTVFYELKLDRTDEEVEIHDKKTTTTTQEPVFVQKLKLVEFEKMSTFETSDQASEICSVTNDSVSTTTAVTRDDEDDDDEVVHQPPRRFNYNKSNRTSPLKVQNSPSSFGPPGRREQLHQQNRVVGMSPTRRVESSPGRRYGAGSGARVVHQQQQQQQQQQTVGSRRVGSNRRDPGESSGRRSRSPATRVAEGGGGVNNVGRSPSAKRSGRYPIGPVQSSGGPARRLAEEPKMESNYPANESLDNPLVSLECFIFL